MKLENKNDTYCSQSSSSLLSKVRRSMFVKVMIIFCLLPSVLSLFLPTGDATIYAADELNLTDLPPIDQFAKGEIKLSFQIEQGAEHDQQSIAGVPVNLYRVGQLKKDSQQAPLTGEWLSNYQSFTEAPFSLGESSDREYAQIKNLLNYIKTKGLVPDQKAISDEQGEIYWPDLPSGIYLVSYAEENSALGGYAFQDFYINLPTPSKDEAGNYYWQTAIIAKPKVDRIEPTQTTTPTTSSQTSSPSSTENKTVQQTTKQMPKTGEINNLSNWSLTFGLLTVFFLLLKQFRKIKDYVERF